MDRLTHTDDGGRARMVDVGEKQITGRRAVAAGAVSVSPETMSLLEENRLAKGDALAVARLAGIQAGKRASEWIPLCHTIPIDNLKVEVELDGAEGLVEIRAECGARWVTGVEMEAMVAVSAACLALYDMIKGVDRQAEITKIRLLEKSGGRSGTWFRET